EVNVPENYEATTSKTGTVTTLTNTHTPELTEATVKKVWNDENDQDGKRPESLTVSLSDGQTVTLNDQNGWTATISGLPKYANGQEINYTWTENTESLPEGYTMSGYVKEGTATTITNSYKPGETSATVMKVWDDADDQDGIRPERLIVTLSNGRTVTLSEANGWTETITGLPKYASGNEISYTWRETVPEGYQLTGNSTEGTITTLTNTHKPAEVEATVTKVWDDAENREGKRPAELEVTLTNGAVVTLNEGNNWTATVTNLPKYKDGVEISYTWTEGTVPNGYSLSNTSVNGTVTTLTNKYVSYSVTYQYDDSTPENPPALPTEPNHQAGDDVTVQDVTGTIPGYTFEGWVPTDGSNITITDGAFEMPENDVVLVGSWKPNDDTQYTVRHWFQNVENDDYSQDPDYPNQTMTGTTGELTQAAAYTVTGFTAQPFEQKTIAGDGSTIVDIYYNRDTYTVTYVKGDHGTFEPNEHPDQKYGAETPEYDGPEGEDEKPAGDPGYHFTGWTPEVEDTVTEDVTYVAQWEPNTDTKYVVKHFLQNLDGTFALAETENKTGTTDETVTASPLTFTGFTFDSTVDGTLLNGIVAGDGSLELRLYYIRNSYPVSYVYDNHAPDETPLPATVSYKYGETVTVADAAEATGYTFSGWDRKGTFEMPAEPVVIHGSWSANNYNLTYIYTGDVIPPEAPAVPAGGTYTYGETVKKAAVPAVIGYTFSGWNGEPTTMPAHDVVVPGSWTLNKYTVTYVYEGEVPEGAPEVPAQATYAYGDKVPAAPVPSVEGYTFVGWDGEPGTMPAGDVTVVGKWVPVKKVDDTKYTVTYVYLGKVPADAPAVPAAAEYEAGADVPKAEVPSLEGYIFNGWNGEVSVMPAQNVTVTGSWEKVTHTVTIIYKDAITGKEIHERVVLEELPVGQTFSVQNPEIEGYVTKYDSVSGVVGNQDIVITVLYVPNAPTPTPTPRPEGEPGGGDEPENEDYEPEIPMITYQLVDIEDFETPLGLGGLNLNVGECIE
ncbi:MAG: Cna B-type domain-containing protein, partial [Anaerolineaceae bacterium]|nr:Cna B-type domain-containing protein [Anaerolineaceae bacterium]